MQIVLSSVVLILLACPPVEAQVFDDGPRGPSLDGAPGLFKTWDAEPIRQGEVFFSAGALRTHRDPGQLSITAAPVGMAIGLFDRVEIFGMWEVQKRIQADGIETNRLGPGDLPRLTTTVTGEQLASSSAPFMDVPRATGRGELYGRVKVNILSERRGWPLGLSVVATGKIPGHKTAGGLNQGLSTGDTELGFGGLVSKRVPGLATFHFNTLLVITAHPEIDGIGISDLQNRFVIRGGVALPISAAVEGIAEIEAVEYFFHTHVEGLNPTAPVDIFLGLRGYPSRSVSVGAGYVASINHIEEDLPRGIRPAGSSGFVVQLGLALRRE